MRSLGFPLLSLLISSGALLPVRALCADEERSKLPDEIEAIGGEGAAQAHAGSAALSDQSAIHLNPAMLYRHRSYDVGGNYFWPVEGRPFYRLSVIDGVTSKWTAAAEFTGFADGLGDRATRDFDSPVRRRASVAFAIPADRVAIGLAGHYVEAEDPSKTEVKTVKGFTLGAGIAGNLTQSIRAGASVENFNNKAVKDVSPQIMRVGIAFEPNNFLMLSADYRERKTSKTLEDQPLTETGAIALADPTAPAGPDMPTSDIEDSEKMAFVGAQVKTMDVLKLFLAGGQTVQGERKSRVSGGVGIYQKNFSLAYAVSRDYPDQNDLQGSLYLSIIMKM